MKHKLNVTLLIILLFLVSHLVGLFIIKHYLPKEQNLPLNIEKPQFEEKTAYIQIIIMILVATAIILVLLKFKAVRLFKVWFFLSIFACLTIAFGAFVKEIIAALLSLVLSIFRVFKSNTIVHNFTEVFVDGGLAAIFVPVLEIFSAVITLLVISVYDIIAVWKTKHMISLAKFQVGSGSFAGLSIPYKATNNKIVNKKIKLQRNVAGGSVINQAILGGGDIGFPLMFSGAVMKSFGFVPAFIVSIFAAIGLFVLFVIAKKHKFYPAMPFITTGCLLGLLVVKLLF